MSGSPNGPHDFGSHQKDCKNVSSRAIINSPDESVLSQLSVDDILELSLQSTRGPIVAFLKSELVGSVLPSAMTDIIDCMNSGNDFKGKVISLKGAHCEILITAK